MFENSGTERSKPHKRRRCLSTVDSDSHSGEDEDEFDHIKTYSQKPTQSPPPQKKQKPENEQDKDKGKGKAEVTETQSYAVTEPASCPVNDRPKVKACCIRVDRCPTTIEGIAQFIASKKSADEPTQSNDEAHAESNLKRKAETPSHSDPSKCRRLNGNLFHFQLVRTNSLKSKKNYSFSSEFSNQRF